jgi:hypothetical protein
VRIAAPQSLDQIQRVGLGQPAVGDEIVERLAEATPGNRTVQHTDYKVIPAASKALIQLRKDDFPLRFITKICDDPTNTTTAG